MGAASYVLFGLIGFGASIVGAICGIGGGVIIKPLLDAFHILDVKTISFLSGCTVLSMSTYSVLLGKRKGGSGVNRSIGLPLAIGGAVGGLLGKLMFQRISSLFENEELVGGVQAACLLIVTIGTLLYTLYQERVHTMQVEKKSVCVLIGLFLGILSSFLGIGGGPINLVVLFFFFSMEVKQAAQNSLYIIFFSQLASLFFSFATRSIPAFPPLLLAVMVVCGILGGMCGRKINRAMDNRTVNKLFIALMGVLILINVYNVFCFIP